MIEITLTIQETDDGISLRNFAQGTATENESAFALRFRDMLARELPKLYSAEDVKVTQTKSHLDIQRLTQN